ERFSLQCHTQAVLEQYSRARAASSREVMKTLLVAQIFPPMTGGSGRWLHEIYRRLPRERFLIAAGEHPQQAGFDAEHDLRLMRSPLALTSWGPSRWSTLRGYIRAISDLRRLVRAEGIQMVHCSRCLPEGLMALVLRWLTGARFGCYVHGEEINVATTSRELV